MHKGPFKLQWIITALIHRLIDMDVQPEEKLVFTDTEAGWRMAA